MDTTTNAINWFEIPVNDIERATEFYSNIFGIEMNVMEMPEMNLKMAMFPYEPGSGKLSGGLAQSPMHAVSEEGTVVYLNANPDLNTVLEKIEGAGGSILMAKTSIGENGHMAFFTDTEGNKMALHSQN